MQIMAYEGCQRTEIKNLNIEWLGMVHYVLFSITKQLCKWVLYVFVHTKIDICISHVCAWSTNNRFSNRVQLCL